jgi:hypothetical protein
MVSRFTGQRDWLGFQGFRVSEPVLTGTEVKKLYLSAAGRLANPV